MQDMQAIRRLMGWSRTPRVKVQIPRCVLDAIFDECDKYDSEETGGRLVGFFEGDKKLLQIRIHDVIGPGPKARRTATSFFQDGEYQEREFRRIEESLPSIEHLGNWHSHHVNGLETLSDGDIATYGRTVNHAKHNTQFFYSILVTHKNRYASGSNRYTIKHFLFLRGSPGFKELLGPEIEIVNERVVIQSPRNPAPAPSASPFSDGHPLNPLHVRVQDRELILSMYPDIRPFMSEKLEAMYWRGRLDLIDNTSVEVLVMETLECGRPAYEIAISDGAPRNRDAAKQFERQKFSSAQLAIWSLERVLNSGLFEDLKRSALGDGQRGEIKWK
jgi:hypothetical protein